MFNRGIGKASNGRHNLSGEKPQLRPTNELPSTSHRLREAGIVFAGLFTVIVLCELGGLWALIEFFRN